jgi:hypothetical protein
LSDISDSAVRELAQKILARPEYADARPSSTKSWLLSMLRRLLGWLGGMGELRMSAPTLYWLMIGGLFLILAIMVAHIVWTISAALRAPEPPTRSASGARLRDHAAEAELLAASGSYLEAAHHLMIASFRTLAERSVIDLRPDRSNRWIRRALRDSKLNEGLVREIDRLVARTERHWFGDRENSPAIYSDWKSAFDQVSRAI